jgi:hypothetical protein
MTVKITCVMCGEDAGAYGHNPYPLKEEGRCCDECNWMVIQARLDSWLEEATLARQDRSS